MVRFLAAWFTDLLLLILLYSKQDAFASPQQVSTVSSSDSESSYVLKAAVIADKDSNYDVYVVRLTSEEGKDLGGFQLEARSPDGEVLGGSFSTQPNTKPLSSGNYINNTLVISNGTHQVAVTWTPPTNFNGQVVFWSTLFDKSGKAQTVLKAEPVIVKTGNWTRGEENVDDLTVLPNDMEEASKGCNVTKDCFGYPDGCLSNEKDSCEILVSFAQSSGGVHFQLTGQTSKKVHWIAVGLSDDQEMGDDSVTDCILLNSGKVNVQQSWNYRSPRRNKVLSNPREGIHKLQGKVVDGTLSCSWRRDLDTSIQGNDFNLVSKEWYLLLARGPVRHGVKSKHHGAIASEQSYNLTRTIEYNTGNNITSMLLARLAKKQGVIDNYRKSIKGLQEKVDRARKEMLTVVQTLTEGAPYYQTGSG